MSHINNPVAYEAAVKAKIIHNANKTWLRNIPRAQEIERWVICNMYKNDFAASLDIALNKWGKLSEKQCAAVVKCIDGFDARKAEWDAAREAEHAAADPIGEGRQVVTGEVLSLKLVSSMYGDTTKMVVRDDRGFKVYGTVPQSLWDEIYETDTGLQGQRVSFTATVSPSPDDEKFGFFKRPSKAALAA